MKNKAVRLFIQVIFIYMVVLIVANTFAVICMTPIYPYLRYKADWDLIGKILLNKNEILMPISFAIPIVIAIIYLIPIYRAVFRIGRGEKPDPLAQRRLLNSPFVIGLTSIVGWMTIPVMTAVFAAISQIELPFATLLKFTSEMFISGVLCFVIGYYGLELLIRKFLIAEFFPENRLSETPKTIRLRIQMRFFIFFIAVNIFPVFLFTNILIANMNAIQMDGVTIAVIMVLIIVSGTLLTVLVTRTYQTPVLEMQKATQRIADGDFEVNIPVKSNDEIGELTERVNEMASELKEKELIKDTFGKCVDPKVRDYMLNQNIRLGGEMKEVTVLFSDIRSFTSISEKMQPAEVVRWLNRYFDAMTKCVTDEQGIVNKYIGDAIMALFGAPIEMENSADAALRCAFIMIEALKKLNAEYKAEGFPEIRFGIGIHSGPALAGNIGSQNRMEYTVIGDTVNTASRLESLCKEKKQTLILSESAVESIRADIRWTQLDETAIRGKEKPMKIYTCV